MLVKYIYQTTDKRNHGVYQCDLADFKSFYRKLPASVYCILVSFEKSFYGSKVWLWRRGRKVCWKPFPFIEHCLFHIEAM